MVLPPQKKTRKKKRHWPKRVLVIGIAVLLAAGVGVGIFLANFKRIILNELRGALPGLRISAASVSLRSPSYMVATGVRLVGKRGGKGSVVYLPRADIRFRYTPWNGLRVRSMECRGTKALLRPGVGHLVSSSGKKGKRMEAFPAGPAVAKLSMTGSRLIIASPDFNLNCSLDAMLNSPSTGTLLQGTEASFRVRLDSLETPFLELRDLDSSLSLFVDRKEKGRSMDVRGGGFNVGDFVRSDFGGELAFSGTNLEASGRAVVGPFDLTEVLPHLKKSLPELEQYGLEGKTTADLQLRYLSEDEEKFVVFGTVSVVDGRATVALKGPLHFEDVRVDLPFEYSISGSATDILVGSKGQRLGGAAVEVSRIVRGEEELASGLRASIEMENDAVRSLSGFVHALGGDVYARLSGSFREGVVSLEGNVGIREVEIEEALRAIRNEAEEPFPGIEEYQIRGKLGGRLQVDYDSGKENELRLKGDLSVRDGLASFLLDKRLVIEELNGDVPVECSIVGDKTSIILGSSSQPFVGATMAAGRVKYDEEELASGVLASFHLEDQAVKELRTSFQLAGGNARARLSGRIEEGSAEFEGDVKLQDADLEKILERLGVKEITATGQVNGRASFACAASPKKPLEAVGDFAFLIPKAEIVTRNRKPIALSGVELQSPFEYSQKENVQPIRIGPNPMFPFAGLLTAVRVGYDEKAAEDETTTPKWKVSDVSAEVASSGNVVNFTVVSCTAYDGDITGKVTVSLEKKTLRYNGKLHVQDLDLERLTKGLGVKREKFYIDGLAEGDLTFSGKTGGWDEIRGAFKAVPPGGIIRIEDLEKLMESVPAGKAALIGLKRNYTESQWKALVDGLKEFRYRTATAQITYPPLVPRPDGGMGPDVVLHFEGTGMGRPFDITITIPITFEKD